MLVGQGHPVQGGAHDSAEYLVLPALLCNQKNIARGGIVALIHIGKAVGAGEIGVCAAQFGRAGVHQGIEIVQISVSKKVAHIFGCLVGTGQHHGIQKVNGAHFLVGQNVCVGGLRVCNLFGVQRRAARDIGALQIFHIFYQQKGRHQLGKAGHAALFIGVLLVDAQAGVQVYDIHALCRKLGALRQLKACGARRKGRRHKHKQHNHYTGKASSHGGDSPKKMGSRTVCTANGGLPAGAKNLRPFTAPVWSRVPLFV